MWPPIEVTISSLIKRFFKHSAGIRRTETQDEEKEIEPSIAASLMILAEKIDTTYDLLRVHLVENNKQMASVRAHIQENTKTMIANNQRMDAFISSMEAAYRASMSQPSLER